MRLMLKFSEKNWDWSLRQGHRLVKKIFFFYFVSHLKPRKYPQEPEKDGSWSFLMWIFENSVLMTYPILNTKWYKEKKSYI